MSNKDNKQTKTMNERLLDAGIVTNYKDNPITIKYKNKVIKRPHVENCVETCLVQFGVEI